MNNWWTRKRVTVTGGHDFLGRRVVELLKKSEPAEVTTFSSEDYDLTKQQDVAQMYADQRPDLVIHLAARVGGIGANRENPGRFFYDNAIMGIEVMEQARRHVSTSSSLSEPSARIRSLPRSLFPRTICGSAIRKKRTLRMGSRRRLLVQAQAYRAQYGSNAIYLLPSTSTALATISTPTLPTLSRL